MLDDWVQTRTSTICDPHPLNQPSLITNGPVDLTTSDSDQCAVYEEGVLE